MKTEQINWAKVAYVIVLIIALLIAVTTYASSRNKDSDSGRAHASLELIPGCELIEPLVENGYLVFRCVEGQPVPTPEPTVTFTPPPPPTLTPIPTSTIAPTITPTGTVQIAPYLGAPLCDSHDIRTYHTIWNSDLGCHYDHTHGDDPHVLDDLFGVNIYTWFGTDLGGTAEIGYPWETPNENAYKHGSYLWLVRSNMDCFSQFSTGCITDFRALVHADGHVHGAVTANHSFYLEARVCVEQPDGSPPPADQCGIYHGGGWLGPARLAIDGEIVLDPEGSNPQRTFLHYYNTGNRCCGTWYNSTQADAAGVVPEFGDMWNTVPLFYTAQEIVDNTEWMCDTDANGDPDYATCKSNSSLIQAHIIFTAAPPRIWRTLNADLDGIADYYGYTDRRGNIIVEGCEPISLDCVPVGYTNFDVRHQYQFRGEYREYDVCFNQDGSIADDCRGNTVPSGWFRYPLHIPEGMTMDQLEHTE